ncbi:MAG TPA: hypothetical protein VIL39_06065, partial [Verrucomicrobiae bacterium]
MLVGHGVPPSVGLVLAERIHQTYRFPAAAKPFYRKNDTLFNQPQQAKMRARMLQDAALASAAADIKEAEEAERPVCPKCGARL